MEKEEINKLIDSIYINSANLEHIISTGKINGTLRSELERVLNQAIQSLTEPTQKKGLDLEALEKKIDKALAKETTESLNEWLSKFREDNPLPTQEGVVSAEEVEKIARKEILDSYQNPTSNVHGQYIGFQKGYTKAMHTYAFQTREEEQKEVDKPTAKRLWEMAKEITDLQRKAKELPTDNVMWNWLEEDWFDWLEENLLKLNPNDLREEEIKKHAVGNDWDFFKWCGINDVRYNKTMDYYWFEKKPKNKYTIHDLYNEYLEQK